MPLAELDRAWPLVEAMIADACARAGLFSAASVLKWLQADEMQLWLAGRVVDGKPVVDAVAVTEMLQFEFAKAFKVFLVTGNDLDRWLPHLAAMEAWAKEMGCTRVIHEARKGYARKLRDYRLTHVILEKPL